VLPGEVVGQQQLKVSEALALADAALAIGG
jgi:hypothetical protein